MRQIEASMLAAIMQGRDWKEGNTQVQFSGNSFIVRLHGNLIYSKIAGVQQFSLCGWNTATTRSRLRALGIDIRVKKSIAYCQGEQIDSSKYYQIIDSKISII